MADVVDVVLELCKKLGNIDDQTALQIEATVRLQFGGGDVYVKSQCNKQAMRQAVKRDVQHGKSVAVIADERGISRETIYKLLR